MDGLQLQRVVQDENAGVGPVLHNNKPGGTEHLSGLKPGLSARKAFGSVSNNSQLKQQDGSSGAEPTGGKPRRAFGELSVNRPAQQQAQQQQPGGGKAAALKPARQAFTPLQQAQQSGPAAAAQQQQQQQQAPDLAAAYAAGGVERYAGKTWQQLEEEREAGEEARAAAEARRLAARLGGWRAGTCALKIAADDEDEDDAALLAPQRRPTPPARAASPAAAAADPLAGLLGDDDPFGAPAPGAPLLDLLPDVDTEGPTPGRRSSPCEPRPAAALPCSPDAQPW